MKTILQKKAFTLSELLISLSVLGLISALTLPSVFNSVESQRKKAVFKESINTIQNAFNQCLMDGSCGKGNYNAVYNLVNAEYICNDTEDTCKTETTLQTDPSNRVGFILQNGAYVWGFIRNNYNYQRDVFIIDYNGMDGPNIEGQDILALARCDMEASDASLACTGNVEHPQHGRITIRSSYPNSIALYNEIFGAN